MANANNLESMKYAGPELVAKSDAPESQIDKKRKSKSSLFRGLSFHLFPETSSRVRRIKQDAFSAYGAEIVALNQATHCLVAQNSEPTNAVFECAHVLQDLWASESIEQAKLLAYDKYWVFPKDKTPQRATCQQAFRETVEPNAPESDLGVSEKFEPQRNKYLMDSLLALASSREIHGKEFSQRAYVRAAKAVGTATVSIESGEQARKLFPREVGAKITLIINDILRNGDTFLAHMPAAAETQTLQLFRQVYGVGTKMAQTLYAQGCRTLADVREAMDNHRSSTWIDHSEEFLERISRTEVAEHYALVKQFCSEIEESLEAHAMGSFRRQKPDCGDIDIIITKHNATQTELRELCGELIDKMFAESFAKYTFSGSRLSSRWMGATALNNGRWRRMDILCVETNALGAAFIYYTGSAIFNRQLRLRARLRGMHLNEKGLLSFDQTRVIESQDERRIFELLDVEYVEPSERSSIAPNMAAT